MRIASLCEKVINMFVIVGLGNPDRKYENTRHNLGFISLDYIAQEKGVLINKKKHQSLIGEFRMGGHKLVLAKPQTYMNLSGQAVKEIQDFYKVPSENILVIYDDIDIGVGEVRMRSQGSAGTHNGMRSVIAELKTEVFPRIRLGIGRGNPKIPLKDYVLSGFFKEEVPLFEDAVRLAAEGVDIFVEEGTESAMNYVNRKGHHLKEV